jgi:hypothetical protein
MGTCIRIEQQLVRIEAVARLRLVGTVHAVAVIGSRVGIRQIAVKDLIRVFGQLDACLLTLAARIEETDLDLGRVLREQREVRALTVPGRPHRMRQTFPDMRCGEPSHELLFGQST